MATSTPLNIASMPRLAHRSELILALALLGVLGVLLIPLPTVLLDLLLALNLGVTVLLMLITLGATQPLDFSVFPSLLLLLTLFRLSLNVATTRLILLNGHAGNIVAAFGHYVVGGNLVVGLVVFLILVIIQFLVITKGAGRISEVAARFTLDALPGKQMAIDAELNTGGIDEAEARRRRQHLMREAEFHGAMDGASKFVRGDAIAGLVIAVINLIGGIILGLWRGMEISQAVRTYAILTVGDGIVTQVPALIIATASGILVTKAASQTSLGQEIGTQFTSNPRPLFIGAAILLGLAAMPGLPKLPFLALAALLWWGTTRLQRSLAAPPVTTTPGAAPARAAPEAALDDFLHTDRASLEIGARLIPFVEPRRGTGLLDRIGGLRRDLARNNGLWVPPIRVRDNIQLEPETDRFLVNGREVARGQIRCGSFLAIGSGEGLLPLEGEATQEPAFGLPARWISDNDRARAELAGYTVVDAVSVLVTHLGESLRRHAAELLSREDLKSLVDKVRETSPSVVDELIPTILTMGSLHRVITLLLQEHVPISNLTRILESLATHAPSVKDALDLTERVRSDLGRILCDRFRDPQGRVSALVLDPRLELELRRGLHERTLVLEPARLEKLVVCLGNEWRKASLAGREAALLTDTILRRPLRQALLRSLPDLAVLAYQEVPPDLILNPAALIRVEEVIGGPGEVNR
jgi:flagellar biosynthesis protein FlhA